METVSETLIIKTFVTNHFRARHVELVQRFVRKWLWRKRGILKVRKAIVAIQSRYRTWGPKRELAFRRKLQGPRLSRMPSLMMVLIRDSCGCLTRHRAFRAGEALARRSAPIVRLKALNEQVRTRIADTIAPLQSYAKHLIRMRKLKRIQAFYRGRLARKALAERWVTAIYLQSWWRMQLAGEDIERNANQCVAAHLSVARSTWRASVRGSALDHHSLMWLY
jgi:hypothetical protein